MASLVRLRPNTYELGFDILSFDMTSYLDKVSLLPATFLEANSTALGVEFSILDMVSLTTTFCIGLNELFVTSIV